jgi:hypothetical protein
LRAPAVQQAPAAETGPAVSLAHPPATFKTATAMSSNALTGSGVIQAGFLARAQITAARAEVAEQPAALTVPPLTRVARPAAPGRNSRSRMESASAAAEPLGTKHLASL